MPPDFALRFRVVVHAPQVIAVQHWRERAVERKDFQAVPRKIEFADDFGAQQGNHVGKLGEKKAGKDFFGNRGAAENSTAFQNQHLFPCFGQIRGVHQTVVTAANDDHIIKLGHALVTPLYRKERNGSRNPSFY